MKEKVLIITEFYLPSIKGGGPIQSIKNIVDKLSDKFDFFIITADRDLNDNKPFKNIQVDEWVKVGFANIYYTNISKLSWQKTKTIIKNSCCKVLYLNSFFNYKLTIIPLLLSNFKLLSNVKIVIAPRGQFSPGALELKQIWKKVFIKTFIFIKLDSNIIWHATSDLEKEHIQRIFGNDIYLIVANNLSANYNELIYDKNLTKNKGELKIVFISRIHRKKNLKQAIKLLSKIHGNIFFDIYGPIEDINYWNECKYEAAFLPSNKKITYHGIVSHEEIISVFKNHHIFLFPTFGENFGHVISEAFIGGCPVIISDQTPWKNLQEKNVGWDIKLDDISSFEKAIQQCVMMSHEEYYKFSLNAFKYGIESSKNEGEIQSYLKLFFDD